MIVYQGSGVATYTYNLVKSLLLLDNKNEYKLFYSSFRRPKNFNQLEELKKLGAKIYSYPIPTRVLKSFWNQFYIIPVEWCIGKVDIYHSSDFLRPPLLKGTKGITTVHDLTWKIYPEFHTEEIIKAHEKKLEQTIKYNDCIITDSEKSKQDLQYYYPNIKNTIHIIPLAVDDIFFKRNNKKQTDQILAKYQITQPYILYVGAIEPRKNIDTLVRSFFQVVKQYPKLNLVLTGRAGWKNKQVFESINRLNLQNKIRLTGYVENEDLPLIYQGAKLSVYPSSYEGFGLPPLESLAAGIPTLAYNSPSIPNSFNIIVSENRLTKDILELVKSEDKLKIKINAWSDVAKKTLKIYENLA